MSKQLIDRITEITGGDAVFVGSVARYYNNVTGSYRDIDVVIPSSSIEVMQNNFYIISSSNGWDGIIDENKLLYYPLETGKKYHDIFVSENEPSSSLISGSKFCTAEYDLDIHRQASSSLGGDYLHNKVQMLETLYDV